MVMTMPGGMPQMGAAMPQNLPVSGKLGSQGGPTPPPVGSGKLGQGAGQPPMPPHSGMPMQPMTGGAKQGMPQQPMPSPGGSPVMGHGMPDGAAGKLGNQAMPQAPLNNRFGGNPMRA